MSDALPAMPAISEGTKARACWWASPHHTIKTTWGTIYQRRRVVIPWRGEVYVAEVWATAEAAEEPAALFMAKIAAVVVDPEWTAWRETWRSAPQPTTHGVPQIQQPPASADSQQQGDDGEDV